MVDNSILLCEHFQNMLNQAIQLNKQLRQRERVCEIKKLISVGTYLREFGTVQLNIGRHTGKTFFLQNLVPPGSLIIFENYVSDDTIKVCRAHGSVVLTMSELMKKDTPINLDFHDVFVDDFSWFDQKKTIAFYEKIAKNCDQTVVLLG